MEAWGPRVPVEEAVRARAWGRYGAACGGRGQQLVPPGGSRADPHFRGQRSHPSSVARLPRVPTPEGGWSQGPLPWSSDGSGAHLSAPPPLPPPWKAWPSLPRAAAGPAVSRYGWHVQPGNLSGPRVPVSQTVVVVRESAALLCHCPHPQWTHCVFPEHTPASVACPSAWP